ncbi:hypothetical protein [Sulfuricurvum sp.]|uniref:hypothetical protein n=1 Tax=Sulfuricurvum sp. TaxID=2025608 RepID=UPI002607AF18|nr:hypothetical protein [Sulfuricurvum sp.]MDD2782327.1 hypothetical protein [Sulfuricurvum sp.]
MNKIFLAQTDTTVGFLSQDAKRLEEIKMRSGDKPFLKVYAQLKILHHDIRIPSAHKNRIRNTHKTTFIIKNKAFRYVSDPEHAALIRPYGWLYSTSANKSGEHYDPTFCHHAADWIIEDHRRLHEAGASRIYKLGRTRLVRVR